MRKLHRWVAPIPALLLIFIAVTGIILQIDMMLAGGPPPAGGPSPAAPPQAAVSPERLHAMLDVLIGAAAAQSPPAPLNRVELDLASPHPRASLGGGPERVQFDLQTGQRIAQPKNEDLHFLLQNLHAGYVLGAAGQWLSLICGVVLLILGLSGLWVYVDLYRRRAKNGFQGLFW